MKIYLAAPWACRPVASMIGEIIEAAGHVVVVKWWDHPDNSDPAESRRQAIADLDGIDTCEAFVLLGLAPSDGKATEFGYALALNRPCIVYEPSGGYANVFRYHPKVYALVHTLQQILQALSNLEQGQEHVDGYSVSIPVSRQTCDTSKFGPGTIICAD